MNTEDYLASVREILTSNQKPGKELTAAWVGDLVRRKVGSYKDCGFVNFKQVLLELQSRGFLTLTKTEKDALGITVDDHQPELPGLPSSSSATESSASREREVWHLTGLIWRAFVYAHPSGNRYLDRQTGKVLLDPPTPPEGNDWIKIEPIDFDQEQQIAKKFVADNRLDIKIEQDEWPRYFISSLSGNRDHLKTWNKLRSHMVVDHINKWAEENGVDRAILFHSPRELAKQEQKEARPKALSKREIVLEAIRRMDDSELLEIKIRAKDLLNVIFN